MSIHYLCCMIVKKYDTHTCYILPNGYMMLSWYDGVNHNGDGDADYVDSKCNFITKEEYIREKRKLIISKL